MNLHVDMSATGAAVGAHLLLSRPKIDQPEGAERHRFADEPHYSPSLCGRVKPFIFLRSASAHNRAKSAPGRLSPSGPSQ